jgi:hypothetical protein
VVTEGRVEQLVVPVALEEHLEQVEKPMLAD